MRKKLYILGIPLVFTVFVFAYLGYASDSDDYGKLVPLRNGLTLVYEANLYDSWPPEENDPTETWEHTLSVSGIVALPGFGTYYVVESHGYEFVEECDDDIFLFRSTKYGMYGYAGNHKEDPVLQIGEVGTTWDEKDSCGETIRTKEIVATDVTVEAGGVEYDGCIVYANYCDACPGFGGICTFNWLKPGFAMVREIDFCPKDLNGPYVYAVHELVDVVEPE